MNWKRSLIVIVSLLSIAGAIKIVQACGGEIDPYDEYTSFFMNDINKDPAFIPFYFTSLLNYYGDWYDYKKSYPDEVPDPNEQAWYEYANSSVLRSDVDSFVYRYSQKSVENIYQHLSKNEPLHIDKEEEQNTFTQWLITHKDVEASRYLSYAKRCEPNVLGETDYYDDNAHSWKTKKRDSIVMLSQLQEGIQLYSNCKQVSIQLRYAFQILRLSFYNNDHARTIKLYDSLMTEMPHNYMYYRCLSLKAGALYKTGKKPEAAYLYSLVFDASDEMKTTVYTSFKWAVSGEIEPILNLCKNDHEKAVLYLMKGLYDYGGEDSKLGIESLEHAYTLDKKVKGLDIIMTREINRLEKIYMENIAYRKCPVPSSFQYPVISNRDSFERVMTANNIPYLK
ncbi:MAG: hypothetical protein WCG87_07105 [Bacteroidota bacterium]